MKKTPKPLDEAQATKYASALGRKGGQATRDKYGSEHFRKLAEATNKKRWGNHKKKEKPEEENS